MIPKSQPFSEQVETKSFYSHRHQGQIVLPLLRYTTDMLFENIGIDVPFFDLTSLKEKYNAINFHYIGRATFKGWDNYLPSNTHICMDASSFLRGIHLNFLVIQKVPIMIF